MRKGFTLIELLAVIIILAIIALIATPVVLKVVDQAREQADLQSVHGIIDSARLYYSEAMLDSSKKSDIDNLTNVYEKVSLSNKPDGGTLYVNSKGQIMLSVKIRNKCYKKMFNSDIEITDDEDCSLGIDVTKPTVSFSIAEGTFNENNWANHSFNINIQINDDGSGPNSYKYCIDTKNCTPTVSVSSSTGFSEISNNSATNQACVIGIDNFGNESDIICSDSYKLDSVTPALTSITDSVIITQADSYQVSNYFNEPIYGISGGSLLCSPTNTSSLSVGTQSVSCTATSNSGLSVTTNKDIIVSNNTFNLTYGGSGSDTPNSMVQTSDGGYILIASSNSTDGDITDGNNGSTDILVIKINSNGSKAWDKTYGGSSVDSGLSIIETSDGGYILAGYSDSTDGDITDGNNGSDDALVMKLNSDGSKVWDKTYGGTGSDTISSIIETDDGGYILAGATTSSNGNITDGNNGNTDILVMKLNSDGSKVWDKTYGGSGSELVGFDHEKILSKTSDGGYIFVGYTNSSDGDITDGNNGSYDILVLKLNSDGSKAWDKTYGGSGSDYGSSIIETSDGRYVIAGNTSSSNGDITDGNNGSSDALIMKLNSNGSKAWDKTYGGTGSDTGRSIIETSDGGYMLAGTSTSSDGDITDGNNGSTDIVMIKLNSDGSKVWDKTYGGSGSDNVYSIIKTSDDGYILDGYTTSSDGNITDGNNGGNDILVIKTDSDFNY